MNELKTPMQPLNIQNIDLNYSVIINENRAEEDYHTIKNGNTYPKLVTFLKENSICVLFLLM